MNDDKDYDSGGNVLLWFAMALGAMLVANRYSDKPKSTLRVVLEFILGWIFGTMLFVVAVWILF